MQYPTRKTWRTPISQRVRENIARRLDYQRIERNPCSHDQTGNIDRRIEALSWAQSALEIQLRYHVAMERRRRNTVCSAFTKVPPEIALKIFNMYLPPHQDPRDYYRSLYRLIGICHSFKLIINSTPSLWSVISTTLKQQLADTALERSGCAPLYISLKGVDDKGLGALLSGMAHRIRGLQIWLAITSAPELNWPAPLLEELELGEGMHGVGLQLQDKELFQGRADRLSKLVVRSAVINWKNAVFKGLKYLSIYEIRSGITEADVLRILKDSPKLEYLSISDITFAGNTGDTAVEEVNLTSLTSLDMVELYPASLELFIHTVQAPNCRHLCLGMRNPLADDLDDPPPMPLTGASFNHYGPVMKALLAEARSIQVLVSVPEFSIRAALKETGKRLEVSIPWPASSYYEFFQWFPPLMPQSSVAMDVTLGIGVKFDAAGVMDTLFRYNVAVLNLETYGDVDKLLRSLGNPDLRSNWPLPHLQKLSIEGSFLPGVMLEMLRSRYLAESKPKKKGNKRSKASGSKSQPTSLAPARLKSLRFIGSECMDYELLQKVEKIVGKNVAEWAPDEDEDDYDEDANLYYDSEFGDYEQDYVSDGGFYW